MRFFVFWMWGYQDPYVQYPIKIHSKHAHDVLECGNLGFWSTIHYVTLSYFYYLFLFPFHVSILTYTYTEFAAAWILALTDEIPKKRCTIFPFHPWDHKENRREGVVLWVPQSIKELLMVAMEHLRISNGSCILTE